MAPYYRVKLQDSAAFPNPPAVEIFTTTYREVIREEIERDEPKYVPFMRYRDGLRAAMGTYLARCTPELYELTREVAEIELSATGDEEGTAQDHEEFAETLRKSGEQPYFLRNPRFVRAANERYGYCCRGCAFDFENAYGPVGREYIECHHLNPLSEREEIGPDEEVLTRLDEVTALRSSCHRMVHRCRPAMTPQDLGEVVRVEFSYGRSGSG